MYRFNQHSFVGGQLDRGLMGRQDLERYFQGASKLENFIVRKQGNITKRRGTEMMADLSDLFGTGESIAYSRILPFSFEITGGYYLLFATAQSGKTGCYLLSDDGIQMEVKSIRTKLSEDGIPTEETKTNVTTRFLRSVHFSDEYDEIVPSEDGATSETWHVKETAEPKITEVPYAGEEFNEIGYNQSGDTLFLVHKNHPPAIIVNSGGNITFEEIDFSHQTYSPPIIKSITQTGQFGTDGKNVKTVSYVATYVKNGIESMPSPSFQYSYNLPWGDGKLKIEVDKGANLEEPDYYNIYKKVSSEYGMISTLGTPHAVAEAPECETAVNRYTLVNNQYIGGTVKTTDLGQAFGRDAYYEPSRDKWQLADWIYSPIVSTVDMASWTNEALTLNFGAGTDKVITDMTILLNFVVVDVLNKLGAYTYELYLRMGFSAPHVKFTLGYAEVGSDTVKEITKTVSYNRPSEYILETPAGQQTVASIPSQNPHQAKIYSSMGYHTFKVLPTDVALGSKMTVSFRDELIKAGYTDTPDTSITANKRIETRYIKVQAFEDEALTKAGMLCFQGVNFKSSWGFSKTFEDDYITPDISLTPPTEGTSFSEPGNFPSCVALYTQRLAFASSLNQPFTWWMSCVGDLYNFATHASIRQDDAMEVTVPATEFPSINHMVLSRDLILFCDNGEWIVRPLSGNTLAYDTVECKKQSAIGCAKSVPPLQVGDEIIFADNSKRVIRSIKYQFSSDGYESNDLSILSQSIFFTNPVVSMCYKQHPESLVLCELADGSVAALVYMKEHNVVAWTHHSLGGGWKCRGIASNKAHADETTHVAMLVEKDDGETEIWRVRDDDESGELYAQLCLDGLRFALGSELGAAAFEGGQIVVDLTTGKALKSIDEVAADKEYAVGYPFTSTLISVRPEPQGAETFQWELKNAKKVNIRTLNGSSFTVKEAGMSDEYASAVDVERVIENGAVTQPGLVDKFDILLNGENSRDGRIEIKHDGILPLTIESFSVDYETQPLYGSEG